MMDDMTPKQQTVSSTLDGKPVTADAGQTIWQVAQEGGRHRYPASVLQR